MKYSLSQYTEKIQNTDNNSILISNAKSNTSITLDEAGALMLSCLSFEPKPLVALAREAAVHFTDTTAGDIIDDLHELLSELTEIDLIDSEEDDHLTNLQINVTERCNERCVHCYIPMAKRIKGKMLDKALVFSVIDDFVEMGGEAIAFSGGELFLYKHLTETIEYAVQKGLRVAVLSNLTLISDELIDCFEVNNVDVQVSLYSVNNEVHDSITGFIGSCEKTRKAIIHLCQRNVNVIISCPVMQQNLGGFEAVLDFAESIGAKVQCNCALVADLNRCKTNLNNRLSSAQAEEFFTRLLLYRKKQGQDNATLKIRDTSESTENYEWYTMQYPCSSIHSSLSINGDGSVNPCSGWNMPLGNIHHNKLKSIWCNIDKHKRLLNLKNKDMGKCCGCLYYDFCYVCPATKSQSGCELSATDEAACELAKIAFDIEQKLNKQ